MHNRPGRVFAMAAVLACLGSLLLSQSSQAATGTAATGLVGTVPSTSTPSVLGASSVVSAIAVTGGVGVLGGTFTEVADPDGYTNGKTHASKNLVAFNRSTGAVTRTFTVRGTVSTLLKGPTAGTVYVGGLITKINKTAVHHLALVDVTTGKVRRAFEAPRFDAEVTDLVRVGKHLLAGGKFTRVGSARQTALVSLNYATGRPDHWVSISVTGHHNWRNGHPEIASGRVGITRMQADSKAGQLVIVGNFTKVGGLPRDQVALITLTGKHPAVSKTWATKAFTAPCNTQKFDSWVRDVAISPKGGYAVIVSSGGHSVGTPCDGAARLELTVKSTKVKPTWIASTGGDTLETVAIGASAIYVGGHMRWMNDRTGGSQSGAGAVPRPSLAALDPASGLPYSWNPGRHPRGVGVSAMLLTDQGLYLGSDTDWLGNQQYLRPRIALLPTASGTTLTGSPKVVDVYHGGAPDLAAGQVRRVHVGSTGVDHTWGLPLDSDIDWTAVRGAFSAGGRLWTVESDGSAWQLYSRTFDGTTFGTRSPATPWLDPVWDAQQTGSYGNQTYEGRPSSLAAAMGTLSGIAYADKRIFYSVAGSTTLHWRWFNPESGIVGDQAWKVPGVTVPTSTSGLFAQSGSLYVVKADGSLVRRTLSGSSVGTKATKVSSIYSWTGGVTFSGPGPLPPSGS